MYPKSIVLQLCKHTINKDESLDSLYDIMYKVQSSIMALTNVTTDYRAEVITPTILCNILQIFLYFSALCLKVIMDYSQDHSHNYCHNDLSKMTIITIHAWLLY